MNTVKTEKELAKQIENNADMIVIEGSLKDKVIRIKAEGKASWIIALGAIGVAVAGILAGPATGGISASAAFLMAPAAVTTLGLPTATTAILIAVAAGGVGVLNKLRDYDIVEKNDKRVKLKRN